MSFIKLRNRDAWGLPLRYRSASEAGLKFNLKDFNPIVLLRGSSLSGYADGAEVLSWTNEITGGRSIQGVSPYVPVKATGENGIYVAAVSKYLTVSTPTAVKTVIMQMKRNALAVAPDTTYTYLYGSGTGNGLAIGGSYASAYGNEVINCAYDNGAYGAYCTTATIATANQKITVAIRMSGSTVDYFFNGVKYSQNGGTTGTTPSTTLQYIGAWVGGGATQYTIYDFMACVDSLSDADIVKISNEFTQ